MMFSMLLFLVVSTTVCQATPANHGRLNQENTFNVHQLTMNYILGNAKDNRVPDDGAQEQRGSQSLGKGIEDEVQLANRILEQVNVNGNRSARAVETLTKELKSLAGHQQTILGAIHDVADQESDVVSEAVFNETMRRVQSDLDLLIASVQNISKANSPSDFPTAPRCPYGFTYKYDRGRQVNNSQFNPSCYKFVRTQMSWLQARRYCRSFGGDLVTIETRGENAYLTGIIRRNTALQKPDLVDYKYFGYWTSGNDNRDEGDWRWATTDAKISFTNWNPGEPNNNYRSMRLENCLHFGPLWNWNWNDIFCGDEFQGSICERASYD